jgi:hypothetical protein
MKHGSTSTSRMMLMCRSSSDSTAFHRLVHRGGKQRIARPLDRARQRCLEGGARQARRDGRQNRDGDGAGMLEEGPPRPQSPRVGCHRDHRQSAARIERRHTRLVGVVSTRSRPCGDPGSLRKDHHLAAIGQSRLGVAQQRPNRCCPGAAIDADLARPRGEPAINRDGKETLSSAHRLASAEARAR